VSRTIIVSGIRGIPAAHGGFETFAEYLALYLVNKGWAVTVYCQEDSGDYRESEWNGIHLIHIPVKQGGALGTVIFDFKCVLHSLKQSQLVLTLGYNTAIFNLLYRIKGIPNLINMDGIEWRRSKWSTPIKTWFWLNEKFGSWFGTHLIADHPEINRHLQRNVSASKITTIAYGAESINTSDPEVLRHCGLDNIPYAIVIARPEPENSILEIVTAFSRKERACKLVILGRFDDDNSYHQQVITAANDDVVFLGAIYDKPTVQALRHGARFYIHGHQVGGTNPSLVEAMGAGSAVLAHDNKYNRWVVQGGAVYFKDTNECESQIDRLLSDDEFVSELKKASQQRFEQEFTWNAVLIQYENLLQRYAI